MFPTPSSVVGCFLFVLPVITPRIRVAISAGQQ